LLERLRTSGKRLAALRPQAIDDATAERAVGTAGEVHDNLECLPWCIDRAFPARPSSFSRRNADRARGANDSIARTISTALSVMKRVCVVPVSSTMVILAPLVRSASICSRCIGIRTFVQERLRPLP
jgi:hypothetical protein